LPGATRQVTVRFMKRLLAERRERSKQLFGNSYMLELCAALDDVRERTRLTVLAEQSGIGPSLFSAPLRRLRQLELVLPDPHPDDDHRDRWFRPAQSSLWATSRELLG
jgi:hypothetical protein